MKFTILGMGTAVPPVHVDQAEGMQIARVLCCRTPEQETWLPAVYQQTGIDTRHLCLGDDVVRDVLEGTRHSGSVFLPQGTADDRGPTTRQRLEHYARLTPPLALASSGQALARAGLAPRDITHLITVSCTGFFAPGLDRALIEGLGLAPTVERTHVGYMGCHGALNGLRVARAFAAADPAARILLCATELCSLHYYYGWDPQRMIANALFSDGSAALVGAAEPLTPDPSPRWEGEAPAEPGPDGSAGASPSQRGEGRKRGPAWQVTATGSCLVPDSADAMTWTIGDHGFEMTLSRRVPALIATHLRPWLEVWLGGQGLSLGQVASWAIHPGGPRILAAVEEALDLPRQATAVSREVFAENGNMSSPTVLFILDRLRSTGAERPCVAMGFGPGLMAEAVLLR